VAELVADELGANEKAATARTRRKAGGAAMIWNIYAHFLADAQAGVFLGALAHFLTAEAYGCDASGGPPTEKRKADACELSFGAVVSDDELVHLEQCIKNPAGPSPTILKGAALLRGIK
jgi:hypothetical protein